MYDYNITAQELADYKADMLEINGQEVPPTEEEMEEMAKWYGES